MSRLFLDTNIIIDLLIDRKPFSDQAEPLLQLSEDGLAELFISAESISNIFYIIKRFVGKDGAMDLIMNIRRYVSLAATSETIIDSALQSNFNDLEDAIQYYSALSINADAIVTRNEVDFKASELPVFDAVSAVAFLSQE